jgi:hypothetical protein
MLTLNKEEKLLEKQSKSRKKKSKKPLKLWNDLSKLLKKELRMLQIMNTIMKILLNLSKPNQ